MKTSPLSTPWAPQAGAYSLPGSLLLKLALGEAPEHVPAQSDIRADRLAPAKGLDGGILDRLLRRFAGSARIARIHGSAAGLGRPGARHRGYDDLEQVLGLARSFRVDVPRGTAIAPLLDALAQVATVETATPNLVSVTPFEAAESSGHDADWEPWAQIRAEEALAYEPGDPGVALAVIDSGVVPTHPELEGRLLSGLDTVGLGRGDLALGLELLGDSSGVDTRPVDHHVGHGMGCAGIAAAIGLDMCPGLGGGCRVMPMRALGAARFPGKTRPVGVGAASDLDMALKAAVDLGAKVVNMSFGTDDALLPPGAPKPHAELVAYALERGCVLIAASGNDGEDTCYWPAAYPDVIAVGSVDATGRPSRFTTHGPHVALCAPGEHIRTLGLRGCQYVTGTSFAAPFVAAAAALLTVRARRRSVPLTGRLARGLLVELALPFSGTPSRGYGGGVLDACSALQALDRWIDGRLRRGTNDELTHPLSEPWRNTASTV